MILFAAMFWGESQGKAVLLGFENSFIITCLKESYEFAKSIETIAKENKYLKDYLDSNKVIKTDGSYLLNYIDSIEKGLPNKIKVDPNYISIVKQYK